MRARNASRFNWGMVVELLTRFQPVSVPMAVLALLVPLYFVIGEVLTPERTLHVPELSLDRLVPQPGWSLIYGSLYVFVLLPAFVVHQQEHIRRTVLAYLMVWIAAFACFLAYPTVAPRPATVVGEDFFAWVIRFIYACDPPYNCFPSLHVAQSFLSALSCYRVHRGVGFAAGFWASLIAISTLYTKQHYILDVIAGIFLAYAAYVLFMRSYPREAVPERERRIAPVLALVSIWVYVLVVACFWFAYTIKGV